jgi:hypothetical protein
MIFDGSIINTAGPSLPLAPLTKGIVKQVDWRGRVEELSCLAHYNSAE